MKQDAVQLRGIQALRALAVLMVLFYHVAASQQEWKAHTNLLHPFIYFGSGGVEVFFAISGFIMIYISRGHFGGPGAAGHFLYRRISRIYPIYWIAWILTGLLWIGVFDVTQCSVAGDLISAFFLASRENCFVKQAWSLHYEAVFYLAFSGLLLFRPAYAWAIGIAALVTCFAIGVLEAVPVGEAARYAQAFLFFAPGCLIAPLALRSPPILAKSALVVGILAIAGAGFANAYGFTDADSTRSQMVQFSIPSAALIYAMVTLERAQKLDWMPAWAVIVGNASYSIYLVHLTVFPLMRRLFVVAHIHNDRFLGSTITTLALAGSSILIGIAVYYLAERPLLALTKRFKLPFGERWKLARRSAAD